MPRMLPMVAAIAIVLGGGLVHGVWTDRWAPSSAVTEAAERLEQVPLRIGAWEGQTLEFNAEEYAKAGIVGGISRHYVHPQTKVGVSLLIVCGRPGPISVHTPDVCYPGIGYEVQRSPTRQAVELDSGAAEFWSLTVARDTLLRPHVLGIHFGWSADGNWQAPRQSPRWAFADAQALYKVYLIRELAEAEGDEPRDDDPSLEFIRDLIPALREALFPSG